LAEMTQQIHSFRASGVRSFQAACVVAFELRAVRISPGILCTGPALVSFLIITPCRADRAVGFNADAMGRARASLSNKLTLDDSFAN
jgi:hypothetical protein